MKNPRIQELPNQTGYYLVLISRFNKPCFEIRVYYSFELGAWFTNSQLTEKLGETDQIIHNAEWHDINSFTPDDKFDLTH